jgi:hypothetical protein
MADAAASKAAVRKGVRVRVPLRARRVVLAETQLSAPPRPAGVAQAVRAGGAHGIRRSLDELTDEQLDLPVDMTRAGLGMWQGRDLYELHGSDHPHIHGGEIAVLKCLLGALGWAESEVFRAAVRVEDFGK